MKLETINNKSKRVNVDVEFGVKMVYSPYIVSKRQNATDVDQILLYFISPTLEDAVKKVVRTGMLDNGETLYLITGDGQEVRLSIEVEND